MADPFEHVVDQNNWQIFESLHLAFRLPGRLTKYMVLELIVAAVVVAIFVPLARRVQTGEPVKGKFWNAFETLLTFIRDQVVRPCVGVHDADRFVPFFWTMFLFILFCNLLGMFPFMGSPTASISVTGALALCTFCLIHGSAIFRMGLGHYVTSQAPQMEVPFGLGYFLVPMIIALELIGHLIKSVVLAVRLFANMFAGHTVLAFILMFIVMAKNAGVLTSGGITLASVVGSALISLLELFVAFLQAYIFVFLASLFLGMVLHPEH
jgi:F-type H+-transporting ATPase subunit a